MISIPFTKVSISWQLLAIAAIFMFVMDSWWKGLLAVTALFGGLWLVTAVLAKPITMLLYGRRRLPDETWEALGARMDQETAAKEQSRAELGQLRSFRQNMAYVTLDCGHTMFDYCPGALPAEDQPYWCGGHRRYGPAEQHAVVSASRGYPVDATNIIH